MIDRNSIKKLGLILNLSEKIIGDELSKPKFVWALRDCFMKATLSDREYLNKSLSLETNNSSENENDVKDRNLIRNSIKKKFLTHDLVRMPKPVSESKGKSIEEMLQHLDQMDWSELRPKFRESMDKVCNLSKGLLVAKTYKNSEFTGKLLVEFMKKIVQQINSNSQINIESSFTSSLNYILKNALSEAIGIYRAKFDKFMNNRSLPVKWYLIENEHSRIKSDCEDYIYEEVQWLPGTNQYDPIDEFGSSISKGNDYDIDLVNGGIYYEYINSNRYAIKKYNSDLILKLWNQHISPRLNYSNYFKTTSEFETTLQKVSNVYDASAFKDTTDDKTKSSYYQFLANKNITFIFAMIGEISRQKLEAQINEENRIRLERERQIAEYNRQKQIERKRALEEQERKKRIIMENQRRRQMEELQRQYEEQLYQQQEYKRQMKNQAIERNRVKAQLRLQENQYNLQVREYKRQQEEYDRQQKKLREENAERRARENEEKYQREFREIQESAIRERNNSSMCTIL